MPEGDIPENLPMPEVNQISPKGIGGFSGIPPRAWVVSLVVL